jgi:uncharacterized protein (TIGR03437 family)
VVPSGASTAGSVVVVCGGLTTPAFAIQGGPVSPALFTANQSGTGQAAIVNQDATVSTTSTAGTYVQIYGTGFGDLLPAGTDGLRHLALTVTATIGALPATVLYSGEAPSYTLGLQQINIFIPAGVTKGTSVALVLTVGGVTTQTGVTLGIQ